MCHNVNQGGMRSGRALQMRDLIKQGRSVLAGKSSEQISKHIDEMGRRNAKRLKELNNVA